MSRTLSLRSLAADAGAVLKARWIAILLVLLAAGPVWITLQQSWRLGGLATMLFLDPQGPFVLTAVLVLIEAVVGGLLIHLTLTAAEPWRSREALAKAWRATTRALPALLAIGLAARLPSVAGEVLFLMARQAAEAPDANLPLLGSLSAGAGLAVAVFLTLTSAALLPARAAAMAEGLSPSAAIRRGLALTRRLAWPMIGLFLLGAAPMALAVAPPIALAVIDPQWREVTAAATGLLTWPLRAPGLVLSALVYLALVRPGGPAAEQDRATG
ncbi:hypothetical protein [Caulobacter mirabilis]|uniref:Uncharacterized protein n=1 Tax=Caulobacter mirabilis TaxID=69666 RepID=A0A2D2AWA9_9CAUL|nr:hypothetical protein [Caulobacter mirabilis]ATQ42283.1 hypothetical protein CSW64_07550 [Caulobacter mirabilis]